MRRQSGFTLVELLAALSVAAVLAGVAVPSVRAQVLRSHRSDAVAALTRLQAAQERQRDAGGAYAADLGTLRLPATSDDGRYAITLAADGPDAYRATAQALGAQADDADCTQITLAVHSGFAQPGPTLRCWNR